MARPAGPLKSGSKSADMKVVQREARLLEPPIPSNETHRLAALHELKILDTPPEERFDRITRLARRLFDVPIALVSLIDADRQWFKSRVGLEVTETCREISFCAHAILRHEVLVVPDATDDPRFSDNPLVIGAPLIRFYAGCPLRGRGGHRIGTLCLIDRRPRDLTAEDLEILRDLAGTLEQQLLYAETATVDGLTGLTNRHGLTLLGDYLLGVARRDRTPLCALFFDLDGFKAINDLHGHAAGDRAIFLFAQALATVFRESDIVARVGGDEFCALMREAVPADVLRPLVRLDEVLSAQHETTPFEIRYSVGTVAYDPERHARIADVIDSADRRMYLDKLGKQAKATTG